MQVSAFKNAITTDKIKSATSRDNLKEQIHTALNLGDVGFIATFLARFEKDSFVARSNGVLPDDDVADKTMDVFPAGTAIGGHVIGDSDNTGDKLSEKNVKSPEIRGGVHVRLKIEGDVRIEAIKAIAIAEEKDPDEFRKARFREVKDAAIPMQSKL